MGLQRRHCNKRSSCRRPSPDRPSAYKARRPYARQLQKRARRQRLCRNVPRRSGARATVVCLPPGHAVTLRLRSFAGPAPAHRPLQPPGWHGKHSRSIPSCNARKISVRVTRSSRRGPPPCDELWCVGRCVATSEHGLREKCSGHGIEAPRKPAADMPFNDVFVQLISIRAAI